ncbi:MAG: DUF63 family protein [Candidatus Micrarchaeota archaeon]
MGFFEQYFINPIWDRTGYNPVNTITYGIIALLSAYLMFWVLKKEKVRMDQKFILSIIPFILLGSTVRSIVDAVDRGGMSAHKDALFGLLGFVQDSHVYDYGYLTVTPGIYIVIGLLTFFSILLANRLKKPLLAPIFGLFLWVPHLLILVPLMTYWTYGLLVIAIALIGGLAGYFYLKKAGVRPFLALVVFSHAFDGAATYVTINIWNKFEPACSKFGHCYGEQHVVSSGIGELGNMLFAPIGGYFLFFLIKIIFSTVAAQVTEKDAKGEERDFIILLLIIFGLAPGVRDILTLVTGA